MQSNVDQGAIFLYISSRQTKYNCSMAYRIWTLMQKLTRGRQTEEQNIISPFN